MHKLLPAKSSNGYNLTDGGKTTSGYSPTKETRDKISAKLKGKPSSNKGKPLSEEHKAKLSANHADVLEAESIHQKKSQKCLLV